MDWLIKVRAGDFAAIPTTPVTFLEASEVALSIDGYAITGSVARVQEISNRVVEEFQRTGRTRASALDLWLALFGQQRAHCHAGMAHTDADEQWFAELVRYLRTALLALTPAQKAGIISVLGNYWPLG